MPASEFVFFSEFWLFRGVLQAIYPFDGMIIAFFIRTVSNQEHLCVLMPEAFHPQGELS